MTDQNQDPAKGQEQNQDPAKGQEQNQDPAKGQEQNQDPAKGQEQNQIVDWRESITDPKLKNVAERFASPADAIKSIIDLRTDNSQRIKVPDANASDEDKAKYRKALGIPDSVDGYKIEPPAGVTLGEVDQQLLKDVLPVALESGIPAPAMNQFVNKFMEISQQYQQQFIKGIEEHGKAAEQQLKTEWGRDYEANLNIANRTAQVIGGEEFKEFLNRTALATGGLLGDHPLIVKLLANIGRRMDEGDLSIGSTAQERTSIQAQIDDLMTKVPPGSPGYTTKEHQAKLQDLYDKLHGRTGIVGSGQRVA